MNRFIDAYFLNRNEPQDFSLFERLLHILLISCQSSSPSTLSLPSWRKFKISFLSIDYLFILLLELGYVYTDESSCRWRLSLRLATSLKAAGL
jgi:hypothetical protein